MRETLAAHGLPAPPTLLALYAWKNGTSTSGVAALDDIHFFPGFYFLSLDDALANYGAFRDDQRWTTGWLPIFANGGGDFYVLDLGETHAGNVRHFRIDESEHPVEFTSLASFLGTLAEGFTRGVFFVDDRGFLEMEDARFAELAAALNPDVGWWQE